MKASVIQGSGLGLVSYLVTAADLYSVTAGNRIFKYADDTYLVVLAANTGSRLQEKTHSAAGTISLDLEQLSRKLLSTAHC